MSVLSTWRAGRVQSTWRLRLRKRPGAGRVGAEEARRLARVQQHVDRGVPQPQPEGLARSPHVVVGGRGGRAVAAGAGSQLGPGLGQAHEQRLRAVVTGPDAAQAGVGEEVDQQRDPGDGEPLDHAPAVAGLGPERGRVPEVAVEEQDAEQDNEVGVAPGAGPVGRPAVSPAVQNPGEQVVYSSAEDPGPVAVGLCPEAVHARQLGGLVGHCAARALPRA